MKTYRKPARATHRQLGATQRPDLYQAITDRLVAHIEEVIASGERWEKPYVPQPQSRPVNLDGRPYSGTNWLLLGIADAPSGCWATYGRWQEAGAQVERGEKGTTIVFMAPGKPKLDEADPDAKPGKPFMILKSYVVFSAEQVSGFDLAAWQAKHGRTVPVMPEGAEVYLPAEAALMATHDRLGVGLGEHGGPPCYIPALDKIKLPARAAFKSAAGRYGCWSHELAHATGAKTRLDRNLTVRFGSQAYAVEELVAEIAAAMICGSLGVATEARKDHACYLVSWLGVLKSDKRCIVTAASKAQLAADMVLGPVVTQELAQAA